MRRSKIVHVFALFGAMSYATSAAALDIAWMTFHPGDNMPSAAAMAANINFTTAPDKGYTDVLTAAGHTVTRVLTTDNPTPAFIDSLNDYDLVIIGRSVSSGHYESDAETLAWNSQIYTPVITMNGYVNRDVRLGFNTGETIPDTNGPIKLAVTNPAHPIFAGVSITGGVTTNDYATIVTMPVGSMAVQRGISVVTSPIVPGGTLLATVAGAPDATTNPAGGGTIIAEFQPGQLLDTSPVNALQGHRVMFLSGSREHAATTTPVAPSTGDIAGQYDLTETGRQMFLNAVNYTASRGYVVPGDVDRNGVTDINDYTIIRNNFNGTNRTRAQGDLIGDGTVNFTDFRYWKNNRTAGAAGGTMTDAELLAGLGIPEPSSLALLALGALAWFGIGRRRALR